MALDARWHKVVLRKRQRVHTTTTSATARRVTATRTAATEQDDAVESAPQVDDDVSSVGRTGAAYVPTATGRAATRIAPTAPPTRHRTHADVDNTSYASVFAGLNSNYKPGSQNVNFATGDDAVVASTSAAAATVKKQSAPLSSATKQPSADNSATATSNAGLSKTAMIGIIAGAAAAALLLFFLVGCCCWRKRKGKKARANLAGGPGEWQPLNASVGSGGGHNVGMQQFGHHSNDSKWSNEYKETTSLTDHDAAYGGYDAAPYRQHDPYANAQQPWAPMYRPSHQQPPSSQQWQSQIPGIVLNSPDAEAPPQPLFAPKPFSSSSRTPSVDSRQNEIIEFASRSLGAEQQEESFMVRSPPVRNLMTPTKATEQPVPEPEADRRDTREATDMAVDKFRQVLTGSVGQPDMTHEQSEILRSSPLRDGDVFIVDDEEEDAASNIGGAALLSRSSTQHTVKRQSRGELAMPSPAEASTPLAAPATPYPPQSRSAFSHQGVPRQPALVHDSRVDSKPLRELEDILDSFHRNGNQRPGGSVRSNSVRSATTSLARLQLHDVTPEKQMRNRPLQDIEERDTSTSRDRHRHSPTSSISSSIPSLSHSVADTPTTPHDSPFDDAVERGDSHGDSPLSSPSAQTRSQAPSAARMSIKRKPVPPAVLVVDSAPTNLGRQMTTTTTTGFEPLSSLTNDTSYRSATMSLYGLYGQDDAVAADLPLGDSTVSRQLSGVTVAVRC
ncbi:hypothetical protein ACM66B_005217 [Microbotryomycetes sp. NB124-2]